MLATALQRVWLTARVKRCLNAGNNSRAEALARKLVADHPNSRDGYVYLFDALFDAGKTPDALAAAEQAITRGINDPDLWNRQGLACLRLERLDAAAAAFKKACALDGSNHVARVNLSSIALRHNDFATAKSLLDTVLASNPTHTAAQINRALVHLHEGNRGAAEQDLRSVLAHEPGNTAASTNLVQLLVEDERLDEAASVASIGLERAPDHSGLLLALGRIAVLRGSLPEAEEVLSRLQSLRTGATDTQLGLAVLLRDTKHYPQAEQLFRELLQSNPNDPLVHFNLSFLLLLNGRFAEGWREYEYRKFTDESPGSIGSSPQWQGNAVDGKLLIYAEQGIGDEIMFASCIPDALQRAPSCVIQCDPRLAALLQRSFPQAAVVGSRRGERNQATAEFAPFAAQVPMGSLPVLLRPSAEAFPKGDRYLRADPEQTARWRQQLDKLGSENKIGVCWRGGLVKTRQASRSIDLEILADALPAAVLVSLQHGNAAQHIEALLGQKGRQVHRLVDPQNNLDELASLISALDVVVSVQSTVVHLSGALGVKCFALIPYSAEWRYLADGRTMPWYRSVTLLRQTLPGDWSAPMEKLRQEL